MTEREELLVKLQEGTFKKEDLERLMDLILENPEEDDEQIMKQLWKQMNSFEDLEESQSTAIMNRTRALIENKEVDKSLPKKSRNRKAPLQQRRRLFFRIAAAASFLLILGTFSWFQIDKQRWTIVSTQYGEQQEVILPDESIVKLNSNSSISFRKHWGKKKTRQVRLAGEAYFEVRKNLELEQKFEVLTKDLKVQVLGTTFNVNAREQMTTVFLEEGKVNLDLENREDDIGMKPGDIVSYSRETRVPERKQVVEEVPASWRNGTMEFKNSPLQDIMQRLKEIYGVEVVYENQAYLERRYRISIPLEKLDVAFEVLKEVTRLDLVREDNKIIVR